MKRTTGWRSQNHHIRGHAKDISEQTPFSPSQVHYMAKCYATDEGFPTIEGFQGELIPVSEADIDTKEAYILIQMLHELADRFLLYLHEHREEIINGKKCYKKVKMLGGRIIGDTETFSEKAERKSK